jgi:hypothetical protein
MNSDLVVSSPSKKTYVVSKGFAGLVFMMILVNMRSSFATPWFITSHFEPMFWSVAGALLT